MRRAWRSLRLGRPNMVFSLPSRSLLHATTELPGLACVADDLDLAPAHQPLTGPVPLEEVLSCNVARVNLSALLADTQALHPREAVRAMADNALEAAGHELKDDATLLFRDGPGSHDRDRSSIAGAAPPRASDPLTSPCS